MSLGRRNSKRDREAQLTQAMSRSIPQELDIVDKGDHLKVRFMLYLHTVLAMIGSLCPPKSIFVG